MPLTFDLPFKELETYQGRSPRPADFDHFWAEALAELDAVDPLIELTPAAFECSFADCFHLHFTGVGGARIHAKYIRPRRQGGPGPAVVQFHGYSMSIGDWANGPQLGLAAEGFSYFGMDCRGQGGLSEDVGTVTGTTLRGHIVRGLSDAIAGRPQKLLFRNIFLDAAQIARIAMTMADVDPARVGAWGGSQGGALAVACAALEPRIRRVAPVYPFLSDFKRVWEMDKGEQAYVELRDWFRRFDPRHEREEEVFQALGYIDIQNLASRIEAEVFWRVGLADMVCPPSSQFAAYNKIRAPKQLSIYPDFGHEDLPGSQDQVFAFMRGL